MHSNYLEYRRNLKNKATQPAAPKKVPKRIAQKSAKKIEQEKNQPKAPRAQIAKKSAKKKKQERAEVSPSGITYTSLFFREMMELIPEFCQETDQPLVNTVYSEGPAAVICHILPKRKAKDGGVPSMAKDKRNIMFFDGEIHDKFDEDMGTKSKGKFVKAMRSYSIMKERVFHMWPEIPVAERVNIPDFLRPTITI